MVLGASASAEYKYDSDGRLTSDSGHRISAIHYNPTGKPSVIKVGNKKKPTPYRFGGKEFYSESGVNIYDFEARMHIPDITLMNSPDPNAADYPSLSPYSFCAANPIKYIDPTGESISSDNYGATITFDFDSDDNLVALDGNGKILDFDKLSINNQNLFDAITSLLKIGKRHHHMYQFSRHKRQRINDMVNNRHDLHTRTPNNPTESWLRHRLLHI